MLAEQYVRSAARIIKALINDYRGNPDRHVVYHTLMTNECLVRSDEMWSILKDQFPKLIEDISVKDLLHKATTTTLDRLGSQASKTHPPPNGIVDRLRLGDLFFQDVIKVHWEKIPATNEMLDSDKIKAIHTLMTGVRTQLQHLGYALRRHNFRNRENPKDQIIIQDCLKDWLNIRYNLPLERAAALIHLQGMVVATTILHAWAKTFRVTFNTTPIVTDDVWAFGGYQILKADNGVYDAIVARNKAFSLFSNVLSSMSGTQAAQGSTEIKHIPNWEVPLMPGDGREPIATEQVSSWDPDPMDMRPPHSIPQPEVKAMPKKPAPKPMPKGSSASSAGHASPKAKSWPTPSGVQPDWVIQALPFHFKEEDSKAEDYAGTRIITRYWADSRSEPKQTIFLLSVMQGPMASAPGISGWAQYLRRVTTYGILSFSQLNTRLVCDESACSIPTDEWFRMYHYLAKTQMQRVFLMCASDRDAVDRLNQVAHRPQYSGINLFRLKTITSPPTLFHTSEEKQDALNREEEYWRSVGEEGDVGVNATRFVKKARKSRKPKLKGSFDCTLDAREIEEVTRITQGIKDFKDLKEFHYLTDEELADMLNRYQIRMERNDDVEYEDVAPEQEPDDDEDVPMAEKDEEVPKTDDAMQEEVTSSRGEIADAIGFIYNASERVQICLYCGSIEHDHEECQHENKAVIKNAFQLIRDTMFPDVTEEAKKDDEEAIRL
eukprot:s5035_g3.t1